MNTAQTRTLAANPRSDAAECNCAPDPQTTVPDLQRGQETGTVIAEVRSPVGYQVVEPTTDQAERHGPQRDVVDDALLSPAGDPPPIADHQCHDDSDDDEQRVCPDRHPPQMPHALRWARERSEECRHAGIPCRTPTASSSVSVPTLTTPPCPRADTNAEPTTTPSAPAAISAACSRDRTPSPTPTGMSDTAFTRETNSGAACDTTSRAPVTPIVEAESTNPRDASPVVASRCGVDDGATSKIRSSP